MAMYGHRLRRALPLSATLLRHLFTTTTLPPPPQIKPTTISRPFSTSNKLIKKQKPGKRTSRIPFEGCDYNHWLIVVDFPQDQKPSAQELVRFYEESAAKVFGSFEEAKKKIYACSTTDYVGFQVACDEETSAKFKDLPGVLLVLPDSYIDAEKKEYGGDKYINGHIISRYTQQDTYINGPTKSPSTEFGFLPPMTPQLNFSLPRPPNRNKEREKSHDPPLIPQQNFTSPSAAQWQQNFGALPRQQNYGPPHSPQQWYGPPRQNFSTPSPAQWSPLPPRLQQNFGSPPQQQNYCPPPPQQQYGSPIQNYSMPPPTQPNMEGVYSNDSPPVTRQQNVLTPSPAQWSSSPPQQNYGLPDPPQQQHDPPQQNFSMPHLPPQNMYANYSPHVTPQQNFSTPSPPQWSPPTPGLHQSFGPSPTHQNYGPPYPPQQQYGPPLQNTSMPPSAQPNMDGVYANYSTPVTPQQNFSRPSPPQWSPSPPHPSQQQYGHPHQNYGLPHPPQQQYAPQSNFPLYQNYGPSHPRNFGPPPQQSYKPGLGDR